MQPIEIITIIACVLIVGSVLGTYIYKKIKHKPTGCSGCGGNCTTCQMCHMKAEEDTKKKDEDKQ